MSRFRVLLQCFRYGVCASLAPFALAQATPSGTTSTGTPAVEAPSVGFRVPTIGGSLRYGISASEVISNGFYQQNGTSAFTNISGNVGYITKSEVHPFSVLYGGGYLVSTTNAPSSFYQSLSFSQVLSTRRWSIIATDSVNYLPQNPTLGLSGVAGVGDLSTPPVQVDPQSGIGILTDYGPRFANSFSLSVSRRLTSRVSANGNGSVSVLRFIGDNSQYGLDSTGYSGSGGVSYAFNSRSSMNVNYSYSHFFFTGSPLSFDSHAGTVGYSRQLRRNLTVSAFGGPQVALSRQPGFNYTSPISLSAGASLGYQTRLVSYSLTYGRGISGGSGVLAGSFSDNASLSASRQFGRVWNTSASLSYTRSSSLPQLLATPFTSNALALGGQVSRGLTRSLSAFGSYSLVRQSASGPVPVNTFSGLYQVVGFGLTYSPSALNLARR